ncbi:hypothetical protein [Rhizobium esperanzae]|uniref:hypothetical protein n=1 Tax=Rhizobium esperanzae TaxID=1967781 RepID=UPI001FD9D27A|nr:hypothetical protein [Rhizobium esperanzae]
MLEMTRRSKPRLAGRTAPADRRGARTPSARRRIAIYTNRRQINELRRANDRKVVPEKRAAWEDKLAQQRSLIQVLQVEERRPVTENAILLKRFLRS